VIDTLPLITMPRKVKIEKALALAILIAFACPSAAQAKTVDQYVLKAHHHCKASYVKKVERVKVKKHGHARFVRETFCVRAASKMALPEVVAPITPPAPVLPPSTSPISAPAPGHVETVLHAHIDPSFVQSPNNPYKVTYQYSASASEGSSGTPVASLPEGVLNLFSDGLLACSINVGGQVMGGECTVTYAKLGEHGVIVTYTSGTSNGTETYVEHIEPFPTVIVEKPTTTKLNYAFSEVSESKILFDHMGQYEGGTLIHIPSESNGELPEALKHLTVGMSVTLPDQEAGGVIGTETGVVTRIFRPRSIGGNEEMEILLDHSLCQVNECLGPSLPLGLLDVWHAHLSMTPETNGPVIKPEFWALWVKGLPPEGNTRIESLESSVFYEPKVGLEILAGARYPGTITEGPTEEFRLTSEHWLPSTYETAITIAGK
jgi:hypothetical protein